MNTHRFDTSRLQRLRDHAASLVRQRQFAGIAWSLEHRGQVIEEGEVGFSDHALSRSLQSDAIYRLYSMTKPVVSVRCLQLVESGHLRLSDPVSRWIPSFSGQQVLASDGRLEPLVRPLAIEDLLMHRAGFSYDFLPDCAIAARYREARLAADGTRPLDELVSILAEIPLAFQPGKRWYYGYSTDVLAQVLVAVCNQPLDHCLQEGLLDPLGMSETGFRVEPEKICRLTDMFGQRELGEVDTGELLDNKLVAMDVEASYPSNAAGEFTRGGIGLFSTLADYRRFIRVLADGLSPEGKPILSAPMINLLWQNRLTAEQMPIDIGGKVFSGYGWGLTGRIMSDISRAASLSTIGEGGWAGAASTYFWVDRQNDMRGIVLSQYLGSSVPLGSDMQTIAYGALCQSSP